jgi:hypothetical protein
MVALAAFGMEHAGCRKINNIWQGTIAERMISFQKPAPSRENLEMRLCHRDAKFSGIS